MTHRCGFVSSLPPVELIAAKLDDLDRGTSARPGLTVLTGCSVTGETYRTDPQCVRSIDSAQRLASGVRIGRGAKRADFT